MGADNEMLEEERDFFARELEKMQILGVGNNGLSGSGGSQDHGDGGPHNGGSGGGHGYTDGNGGQGGGGHGGRGCLWWNHFPS